MNPGDLMNKTLSERRRKPRVGQTVVYYIDGPANERVSAAKIVHVIDVDTVELELRDGRRFTSRYASAWTSPNNTPRPPGSWDYIV